MAFNDDSVSDQMAQMAVAPSKTPRDFTWAKWKIAQEQEWIFASGGGVLCNGAFNPYTWKALAKTKLLGVAFHPDISFAGTARVYLRVESAYNAVKEFAQIDLETVSLCADVAYKTAWAAAHKIEDLGLWQIQAMLADGRYDSSRYWFHESKHPTLGNEATVVSHVLLLSTHSNSTRPSAEVALMALALKKTIHRQASAAFTLEEASDLTRFQRRAIVKAAEWLLNHGHLVKVAEGTVSLPEAIGAGLVAGIDGPLWSKQNRSRPRKLSSSARSVVNLAVPS